MMVAVLMLISKKKQKDYNKSYKIKKKNMLPIWID